MLTMVDYGYVVGTFIHPLGAPSPTDRGLAGTVRFIPHDTRILSAPSREAGKVRETLAMDANGHVEGWFVTGVYTVVVTYFDGTKRPAFDVRVEAAHTAASPLDLVTAAPPIPSPEVVVIASEAERIRAEAAADRAEAAADEVEPVHIYSDADLKAVTHPGPAILHISPGAIFSPPIPASSLITRTGNIPLLLAGMVSILDYSSILPGVRVVTFSTTVVADQYNAQVSSLSAYQNYPAAPSYWTVSDYLPVVLNSGSILRSQGVGDGSFRWVAESPTVAPTNSAIMLRDAFGRSQVAPPSLGADIATKGYVDGRVPAAIPAAVASGSFYDIIGHVPGTASGTPWAIVQGSPTAQVNMIVVRDAAGRAQIVAPSAAADIANKGYVDGLAAWVAAPATATAAGTAGQRAYDANYLYVCVATNTWKRTALATW